MSHPAVGVDPERRPQKKPTPAKVDASIAAVGKRVRKVAAPPISSGEYKLRINFDLDVKR